mmetsp:Transcript_6832/g.28301  ORF Transcript_6832/g.28301 Transcript_6832/m.28301 type:complete len:212 (-) Transcript_6832:668-1303(-)
MAPADAGAHGGLRPVRFSVRAARAGPGEGPPRARSARGGAGLRADARRGGSPRHRRARPRGEGRGERGDARGRHEDRDIPRDAVVEAAGAHGPARVGGREQRASLRVDQRRRVGTRVGTRITAKVARRRRPVLRRRRRRRRTRRRTRDRLNRSKFSRSLRRAAVRARVSRVSRVSRVPAAGAGDVDVVLFERGHLRGLRDAHRAGRPARVG